MTLTLEIPLPLEQRLAVGASRRNVPPENVVLETLSNHYAMEERNQRVIGLLQDWLEAEVEEAEPEFSFLEALDEDRLSQRPLYPAEMKGITW